MAKNTGGDAPEPAGGLGGSVGAQIDPRTPGRDIRLIQRAVRQRWNINEQAFTALPNTLLKLALDPKMNDRARVGASRALIAMHGQNLDEDRELTPAPQVNVSVINCDRRLPLPEAARERILAVADQIRTTDAGPGNGGTAKAG